MDISSLIGVSSTDFMNTVTENTLLTQNTSENFDSVLASAMNMLNETNDLQNDAQSAKIQFALGEAENPHDMQVAAAKASEALQYTVAIRDKMLDAYKEIMNMQI
jgi:flagellar hook-basal body complex protein FliE